MIPWLGVLTTIVLVGWGLACSTLPKARHKKYTFPKNVHSGINPGYEFEVLGPVRAKVTWPSLDMDAEEKNLCHNYYNQAAHDLMKFARQAGGDAVIEMRSVVFLIDGRVETYETPECSDDGEEGQILTQGVAVRRKRPGLGVSPSPSPSSNYDPELDER